MRNAKLFAAEMIGTLILMLGGPGTAVLVPGFDGKLTMVSLGVGFALLIAAYAVGPISGCHINPAVSLGVLMAGRMPVGQFVGYVISQIAGAIMAALVVMLIAKSKLAGYDVATEGLGQNGWGAGYLGEYGMMGALIFEIVATALFLVVILGVTQEGTSTTGFAGLAIGFTLVMIHLVGIPITGTSVNPARSIGPALFVGGDALAQLWLFIVAPLIGGAIGGILYSSGLLAKSEA